MTSSTGNLQEQLEQEEIEQEEMTNAKFQAMGHALSEIMHEASYERVKFTVEQYYTNNGRPVPTPQAILKEAAICNHRLYSAAGDKKQLDALQALYPNFFDIVN